MKELSEMKFGGLPNQALFFLEKDGTVEYVKLPNEEIRNEFPECLARANCRVTSNVTAESYKSLQDNQTIYVETYKGHRFESLGEIMAKPLPSEDKDLRREIEELKRIFDN